MLLRAFFDHILEHAIIIVSHHALFVYRLVRLSYKQAKVVQLHHGALRRCKTWLPCGRPESGYVGFAHRLLTSVEEP